MENPFCYKMFSAPEELAWCDRLAWIWEVNLLFFPSFFFFSVSTSSIKIGFGDLFLRNSVKINYPLCCILFYVTLRKKEEGPISNFFKHEKYVVIPVELLLLLFGNFRMYRMGSECLWHMRFFIFFLFTSRNTEKLFFWLKHMLFWEGVLLCHFEYLIRI